MREITFGAEDCFEENRTICAICSEWCPFVCGNSCCDSTGAYQGDGQEGGIGRQEFNTCLIN